MAKLPPSPGPDALRAIDPELLELPRGTALARIYFTDGQGATTWNGLRSFGPLGSRFDQHVPDVAGNPCEQKRAILCAAAHIDTCVAEVFQHTRRVDRVRKAPWLVIFDLAHAVTLLDLTGAFCTRVGASTALCSGSRKRARDWSRDFYEAYPRIDGLCYASSMNGHAPAVALYERAGAALPPAPRFNRSLADDPLFEALQHAAARLGYGM
jgi:hypothetical protein